ncbi:MAG TPA: FAD-linked oxidase C-terminal domain-containing protein [Candidatus Ozemobacteraceae bacterium]
MYKYTVIAPAHIAELQSILGAEQVIWGDPDRLEPFSHDEAVAGAHSRHHLPEAVVRPANTEQVAAVMKFANREGIPVTPRGAGSGLSGGAVPVHGGIVMTFERMNRILEFDPANLTVTVQPGVVTNEINACVRDAGLFYAGYPMSLETCCIGGNVAENAGGGKAVKYGVTGRYVLGLEIVTPAGEIVKLGGKLMKDVTGYNLIPLLVGSEGTLAVFTSITLRLMPLPKANTDLLVLFRTPAEAIAVVPAIIAGGGIIPTAIEFMDRMSIEASCRYLNESLPWEAAGAMLLITLDGSDPAQVEREYEVVGERCLAGGAIEVYVADNATTSERVWKVRRNIAEAFKVRSPRQSLEDIVVPIAAIPAMVAAIEDLAREWNIEIPCYGHAGDGNLHATPVMNPAWSEAEWAERLPRILTRLYEITTGLGGTLSGEHGIGHKRKGYMPMVCSPAALELMRGVKRAWDPRNILNPGKIFDI